MIPFVKKASFDNVFECEPDGDVDEISEVAIDRISEYRGNLVFVE